MKEENKIENNQESFDKIEAIEIGKVREEKKGSAIIIVVFFLILAIAIIGIPYIGPLIDKINGNNEEINTPNNKKDNNKQPDETEEIKYYNFNNTDINFDDLKINIIQLSYENNTYSIIMKVTANNISTVSLIDKKYYIEIYNADKTLLERIKIHSDKPIYQNYSQEIKFEIDENTYLNAKEFTLTRKEITDYQNLDKTPDSSGNITLTCENNTSKYIYIFNKENLFKVENTESYDTTTYGDTYSTLLSSKRSEVASLDNYDGINASLIETSDGFVINIVIDPLKLTSTNLDYKFYNKHTSPKTVKYELESMRYKCN